MFAWARVAECVHMCVGPVWLVAGGYRQLPSTQFEATRGSHAVNVLAEFCRVILSERHQECSSTFPIRSEKKALYSHQRYRSNTRRIKFRGEKALEEGC